MESYISSRVTRKNSALFLIPGWICAAASLVFYPFLFGTAGVILGILSSKNRSRIGVALILTSIVLMGIGLMFSNVLRNHIGLSRF